MARERGIEVENLVREFRKGPRALLLGFGCAAAIVVLAIGGAAASLRTRVA